jgi:hypothetical protein
MNLALPRAPTARDKFGAWLNDRQGARRRWLSSTNLCVAWLGLLVASLTPPHGAGFTVCWLNATTGLPCPGCGLSRSLSCGLRGLFLESWHYHPLGLIILGLFLATASVSLLPVRLRDQLGRVLESRALLFNAFYAAFVAAFVCFGTARALHQLLHGAPWS